MRERIITVRLDCVSVKKSFPLQDQLIIGYEASKKTPCQELLSFFHRPLESIFFVYLAHFTQDCLTVD